MSAGGHVTPSSSPSSATQPGDDNVAMWSRRMLGVAAMVGGVTTLLMALHITVDVGSRNLGYGPIPATLELTQYWAMVLIVMLGMGQAERLGEHIQAGVLVERLPARSSRWAAIIVHAVGFLTVAALTWFSALAAAASIAVREIALGVIVIPIWPMKVVVAVGFALFMLQLGISLVRQVRKTGGEVR